MLLLLAACSVDETTNKDLSVPTDTAAPSDVQVSVDAVIQQSGWGEHLGRCEISVTFTRPGETDGMMEAPGQLWEPITLPVEDAACAVTIRDRDAMRAALDAEEPPEDNWDLDGRVDVGSYVQLASDRRTIRLDARYDDEGQPDGYEMAGCSEAAFPFGEVFALLVPEGSVDDGIAPFRVENALATGPKLSLTGLGSLESITTSTAYQGDDLPFAWAFDRALPTLDQPLEHLVRLTVRNSETDGLQEFEAIACLADPEDGTLPTSLTVPGADLAALTPTEVDGEDLYLSYQLDSVLTGPDVTLPWGERIRVQSTVSIDGLGGLLP